jgi:hypothetical protein
MWSHYIELLKRTSGIKLTDIKGISIAEIIELIEMESDLPKYYSVDWIREEEDRTWSYGNFQAWFCGNRALVRLDEHREHYATSPYPPSSGPAEIEFEDWISNFNMPSTSTVSLQEASQAFVHWMTTGEMIGSLEWS